MMKAITFQIDDTGKVLVFPMDNSGLELPNNMKFNQADLEAVSDCLFNIKLHPKLYGITAVPFETETNTENLQVLDNVVFKDEPIIEGCLQLDEKDNSTKTESMPAVNNGGFGRK